MAKLILRIQALLFGLLASGMAVAQDRGVNIMGGPVLSTSFEVARDISELTADCGLPAAAHETHGAIDNLLELKERRYTQFALMQSDVLEYLKTYETYDPEIGKAINGIRVAMPLFAQEVHVIASRDIPDMSSLGRQACVDWLKGERHVLYVDADPAVARGRARRDFGARPDREFCRDGGW